jgi:phosphatidyl-myo-inositol dimannoside synthase
MGTTETSPTRRSLMISGTYYPPQVGGISHMMASIGEALGPERVSCLTGVSARDLRTAERTGPRVYRRPSAFARSALMQAMGLSAAIAQIMVQERPQAVQIATVGEGYLGLWLRRWLKLPFLVYAHGNEILALAGDGWPKARLALRNADRVVAVSRFTAGLVENAGVPPERIDLVHPGCDVDALQPRPSRPDLRRRLLGARAEDPVILTVGNIVARKGHDMVLRSLPHVIRHVPRVVYLIVGGGPYRPQLEELARMLGVQDHVVFAGQMPDEDLPDLYALSTVFVMASRAQMDRSDVEGFGLVFLEAGACGKPVVGGRSGGIPDAIEEGTSGFLVNPDEPEDIARALVRLLTHPELAARMGAQGRSRVVQRFQWKHVSERIQEIIEGMCRITATPGA